MKKSIWFLMLVTSITGNLCAQQTGTRTDRTFQMPDSYARRRFYIDLGKGNRMQIELTSMADLERFRNMDSVIRVFLADLAPFKDSLEDKTMSRRIDYVSESPDRKIFRIQQGKPKGETYLVQQGEATALKLEQDTVHFLGTGARATRYVFNREFTNIWRCRISFFVNDLSDLALYADGRLNEKITLILGSTKSGWSAGTGGERARLKADGSITARLPQGYVGGGNFLNFKVSVDAQNYKNYFVPSFSLGGGLILSSSYFKRDILLSWDPSFVFARNGLGRLKALRNDFVTLTWGQGLVQNNEPRLEYHLLFIMSLGYLVNRQGDYFEKNTFRLGGGRLSLYGGKTKLEPVLYFNRFFKGVTPGLRWIQSF